MSEDDKKVVAIALRLLYSTVERLESEGFDLIDYGEGLSKNDVFKVADRLGIDIP